MRVSEKRAGEGTLRPSLDSRSRRKKTKKGRKRGKRKKEEGEIFGMKKRAEKEENREKE